MIYKISWTAEAINNLEHILNYLSTKWSGIETDKFKIDCQNSLT